MVRKIWIKDYPVLIETEKPELSPEFAHKEVSLSELDIILINRYKKQIKRKVILRNTILCSLCILFWFSYIDLKANILGAVIFSTISLYMVIGLFDYKKLIKPLKERYRGLNIL